MRKGLLVLLFTLLLCNHLRAQEEFIPPPSKLITRIPFRMLTGGIITLKAQVSNFKDTLNFILDTGSGGISLDSLTAEKLKLKSVLSERTIRGIAGIKKVRFAYNQQLLLPKLTVDSLNFHINDYEVLTSSYGEKIDGIIGFSFLSRYIVKIDYDSSVIYVYSKGTMKYPRGGFLIRPLLVNLPIVNASIIDDQRVVFNIHGNKYRLIVDFDYEFQLIFIIWFGTHKEYDRINVRTIDYKKPD